MPSCLSLLSRNHPRTLLSHSNLHNRHFSTSKTKPHLSRAFLNRLEKYLLIQDPIIEWPHISLNDVKKIASNAEQDRLHVSRDSDQEWRNLLYYFREKRGREELLHALREKHCDQSISKQECDNIFSEQNIFGNRRKKSKQRWIFHYMRQLLGCDSSESTPTFDPNHTEVITNVDSSPGSHPKFHQNVTLHLGEHPPVHIHLYITHPHTNFQSPLAVHYLPSHHFSDVYHATPLEITMLKDEERRAVCESHGIRLVEIPYTWDGSIESLQSLLQQQVPELELCEVVNATSPAKDLSPSTTPTPVTFDSQDPKSVQRPHVWDQKRDVTGWWLSKKYDGVRAICVQGKLYTKQGVEIALPPHLKEFLASCDQADGELVSVTGGYAHIVSLMKQAEAGSFNENDWMDVQYMMFDVRRLDLTFEERQTHLRSAIPENPFARLIEHTPLLSNQDLLDRLEQLLPSEEGYIIVQPNSKYIPSRVDHVCKAKRYYDSEALFLGRDGDAFRIQLPNGAIMNARVSSEDFDFPHYVPSKTVFTVKYSQINQVSGNPVKPMIFRERSDMTWEEVIDVNTAHSNDTHSARDNSFSATLLKALEERDISAMQPEDKQDVINEIMLSTTQLFPLPQEIAAIANMLQISQGSLLTMLKKARSYKRNPPAAITPKTKSLIKKWMLNNRDLQSGREMLLQETGLSRDQLSRQIYLLKNELTTGIISADTKKFIQEWLEENDHRRPDPEQREYLQDATGLSSKQLSKQIDLLIEQPGEITEESKSFLFEWWVRNGNTHPNEEQRKYILENTGWNRNQLNKQLQIMRNHPGKLSKESKEQLQKWLEENSFKTPSKEERQHLLELTGWSSQQLTDQLRRQSNGGAARVTESSRRMVEQWLTTHANRSPTSDERDLLQQQTSLSRVQLNNLIFNLRNVGGEITPETHRIIDEWLQEHAFVKPTQEQRSALCERTGLSAVQLMGQIRYKRKQREKQTRDQGGES